MALDQQIPMEKAFKGPQALRERLGRDLDAADIAAQRGSGWPNFHPEDFCHRCGCQNVSWYIEIAQHGYPANPVPGLFDDPRGYAPWAFFPLLPALLRIVHTVTFLPYAACAAIVVVLCGIAFACVMWHYARTMVGERAADAATLVALLFPGTAVLTYAYSEILFFPLAVGVLLALRKERWALAGVLTLLAGATRPAAVALSSTSPGEATSANRGATRSAMPS